MSKDIYSEHYLDIVSDPRFKVLGFGLCDILKIRTRMDVLKFNRVDQVLIADPNKEATT